MRTGLRMENAIRARLDVAWQAVLTPAVCRPDPVELRSTAQTRASGPTWVS